MADLKVVKSDVDGWDVIRADEGVALTNHPSREEAEAAAHMRAQEDSISEESEGEVFVRPDEHHGVDDERQGMKTAFFSLGGLLAAVALLAVVIAVIAALTGFGS
jgi:hypothetical protein